MIIGLESDTDSRVPRRLPNGLCGAILRRSCLRLTDIFVDSAVPVLSPTDELRRNKTLLFSTGIGVACASFVLPYYTMGALVGPITVEFGWERSAVMLCLTLCTFLGAVMSPVVGWMVDRFGTRPAALTGLVGLAAGFGLAALAGGRLWLLYLAYVCMAVLGAGTIAVTWSRAISTNFFKRRGLALGIALSGTGLCGALAPSYTVWLVDNFGWRVAYLGVAALPLLLALPLVWLWFHPDKTAKNGAAAQQPAPGQHAAAAELAWGFNLAEAMRQYRFWALLLSIAAIYLAVSGFVPNAILALTENGMSRQQAGSIAGLFGIAIVLGRLLIGVLIDHFWAPGVAAVTMCFPIAGMLMLTDAPGALGAAVATVMIGLAAGAELDLMAFLTARYFGLAHYAKIYGVLYAALAAGSATSAWLFARIQEYTQSYDLAFQLSAALFALSAALMLTLGRYPRQA